MPPKLPNRKPQVGWFVQIPPELKTHFKSLYPRRSQMRKLTILAIQWALKEKPIL